MRNFNNFLNDTRNNNNFFDYLFNLNNFRNLDKLFNNLIDSYFNLFNSFDSARNFNDLFNFTFYNLNVFYVLYNRLFDLDDLSLVDNLFINDLYRNKLRNMDFLNHNFNDFFGNFYNLFLNNWHLNSTVNNLLNFHNLFNNDIVYSFNLFNLNHWN